MREAGDSDGRQTMSSTV